MQHKHDKQRNEQLSALLDNELRPEELAQLMDDLGRDPLAQGETLQRYQLVGKTLRGELDAAAFMDISAAVQRAIAADTVSLSPVRQLQPRWLPSIQTWRRPAAGLAIAASVAMVTVMSVRLLQQPVPTGAPSLVALSPTLAPTPIVPVDARRAQQVQVVTHRVEGSVLPVSVTPQLNNYLMRHSGVAGQATLQGVMPYARSVSFEQAGAP